MHLNADQQSSDIELSLTENIASNSSTERENQQEFVKGVTSHVVSSHSNDGSLV